MHSAIFQISTKPIGEDERTKPEYYYEDSYFADYIGDEFEGGDREDAIKSLTASLDGVFKPAGRDCLVYLGKDSLKKFLQAWADDIKANAAELNADNILSEIRHLKLSVQETHKHSSIRVHIEEYNGWAGPITDLIEFADWKLKEGDKIYVGSVIDYHF